MFSKIIKIPNELKEKINIAKNNVQISHDAKKHVKIAIALSQIHGFQWEKNQQKS